MADRRDARARIYEHTTTGVANTPGSAGTLIRLSMNSQNIRELAGDAIRYWEPRRIIYNLVLAAIVLAYFVASYPHSKAQLTTDFVLMLFLLAVVANIAYCAIYVVDLFAQASDLRDIWRRYRWVLLVIGTSFAGVMTRFLAIGMFR